MDFILIITDQRNGQNAIATQEFSDICGYLLFYYTSSFAISTCPIEFHLFSDLLQNSNNFSFYKKQNLDEFLKRDEFNNVSTNLEGIDFIIWQLNNSMIPISKIFYDFEKILRKMNVGSIERRNIEG